MALTSIKQEAMHARTGSALASIKASFDNGEHTALEDFGPEAAIIYQIQKMQDEITYLRTEISANKDKTGTTSTERTRIAANHAKTGISSGQTSAITANTAKVSFVGGSATVLSFGELITTNNGRGNPQTFSIIMTAVKSGVTKTVTLTLA